MPTINIKAELSKNELLQAAQQLSAAELQQFVQEILSISAKRKAPNLTDQESELLLKINQGIDQETNEKYNILLQKRNLEILTEQEYQDLLKLTHQIETYQAQRLTYLAELAKLRKISLGDLVEQLGIHLSDND